MFGTDKLFNNLFGGNSLLIMLAGFTLLILLNLIVKIILEIKKKTWNWHELPEFIKPIILYAVFLIGLDILVATAESIPTVQDIFKSTQIIGFVAILAKYFKKFYENLKALGMPVDENIDNAFEDKLDNISGEAEEKTYESENNTTPTNNITDKTTEKATENSAEDNYPI